MASLSTDKQGNRRILFINPAGKRKPIYLGKILKKDAEGIKRRVEMILSAQASRSAIDIDTATWIKGIGDILAAKLAAAGLIEPRGRATLGGFIREYIDGHTDLKTGTRYNLTIALDRILKFFSAHVPLRDLTPADADRWLIWLKANYAEATAARTLKHGRQFFHAARRAKLIDNNPFEGIKPGRMDNPDRLRLVSKDTIEKIIDSCPNLEWRAIVALARYGGLRTPSETLKLTWGDILWDEGKFRVRSPKLEHTANKGIRWVPLFPELWPHLEALFDAAPVGSVHVILKTRDSRVNLRTQLERILAKAGLDWIGKPFQNMRASRETELAAEHPLHVVTAWIGHSAAIAIKHYLQVTPDDFDRASKGSIKPAQIPAQTAAESNGWGRTEGATKDRQMAENAMNTEGDLSGPVLSRSTHYPTRIRT